MELYATKEEIRGLISEAYKAGFKQCLELIPRSDRYFTKKYISERDAFDMFTPSRVKLWVQDGLIIPKTNGMGKNSKKFYEYSELIKLDTSDKIKIRKSYKK